MMQSSAFEFTEEQLRMIVDALGFQLMNDEDMCQPCVDDASALCDLLIQHMSGKTNRRQSEERLKRLFEAPGLEE